jgi:feruloyl esterase
MKIRKFPTLIGYAAAALFAAGLAGCSGNSEVRQTAAEACSALASAVVSKDQIGLPTNGARVTTATLVEATSTLPEYCQVLGVIAPVDSTKGYDINFRVNFPTAWNSKAMHFGGGGFNGSVVAGTGLAPSAPPDTTPPLGLGYSTFGSDSGHTSAVGTTFGSREESLVNFGYAQLKKTRDVAVQLMARRYGSAPSKTYWVGSSQGGREGLTVAQRFPADYDGILVRVPVLNFTGLQIQGWRYGQALAKPGAWKYANPYVADADLKLKTLSDAALAACDAADGLVDGVIANYRGCGFKTTSLPRCAVGVDLDNCLTDAQLNMVDALHTPMNYGYTVANGLNSYPGWGWGGENNPSGNWLSWVTGSTAMGGNIVSFGNQFVQNFIAQNPAYDVSTFDPTSTTWKARILAVAEIVDSTNPDLSAFFARGGKLIIQEQTGDYARSPFATFNYYDSMVAKHGQSTTDRFVRLYSTPGANHRDRKSVV